MYLIELFIPVPSTPLDRGTEGLEMIQRELTERFGGVTAYVNSPAKGLWDGGQSPEEDRVIVIEVMVEDLDRAWWRQYRRKLEDLLQQKELLVRAHQTERL
jgi:hypothetical protein